MRRAVPLVVVVEDYFQFSANIGFQWALDAVFQRYDMSDPGSHKPNLVKPFTSVTVVVNEDFLKYRSIILDAAERSDGQLRVEVVASGKTPTLIPETFQLKVPKANGGGDNLVRFAVLINCSQRFHDRLPSASDASNLIDMIHYCSSNNSIPRDIVYFTLVQKLEAFCQTGNLWLERQYRSSLDAAQVMGTSLRNIASENIHSILKSRDTNAHWNACTVTQWAGLIALFAGSAYLSFIGM